MKKIFFSLLALCLSTAVFAQFTTNGANLYFTGGNVGIGTTSPNAKLHLYEGAGSGTHYLKMEGAGANATVGLQFVTPSTNMSLVTYSGKMGVTGGNFGIGTTTPNDLLHVSKTGTNTRLRVGNNSAYDQLIYFNGSADWSMGMDYSNSNAFTIASTSSLDNSQRFTIKSDGNVGIGTNSPAYLLEIEKSKAGLTVDMMLENTSTASASGVRNLAYVHGDNSGDPRFVLGITGIKEWSSGIDNSDGNKFKIGENSQVGTSTRLTIDVGGNVGIGTTSPSHKLQVESTANNYIRSKSSGVNSTAGFSISNDSKEWIMRTDGNDFFQIRDVNNGAQRLVIDPNNGNVGVGTTTPTEKLSVDGTVLAKKVRVSTAGVDWPDYVFAPNFELRDLSELESYIKTNQHLPEVPSAKEVEAEGLDLGDMDATLLKKVEELTLYMIQMNKNQEKLIKEVEALKEENASLKESAKTGK